MTETHVPTSLQYLLAARRAELRGLEELADTCELVGLTSALVHALQKERGYANLYVADPQTSLLNTLNGLTDAAQAHEAHVRRSLARLDPQAAHPPERARLLSRVADALYRLDMLAGLRRRIRDRTVTGASATDTFTRVIAGLLNVVFEAADTALDPELTRTLVAMFNFLQGKELSGQERACGAAGFSAGWFSEAQKTQLRHLVDGQQRCFAVFTRYAGPDVLQCWAPIAADEARVQPLREMAWRTAADATVDPVLAQGWFDLLTERIDAMKTVDALLADTLLRRSRERLADTRRDLENHRALSRHLADQAAQADAPVVFDVQGRSLDAAPGDGVGGHMGRSLLDLLQEQAQRLQDMADELADTRTSLADKKAVDEAKAWLIRQHRMSEASAHERLQKAAMESGLRLGEVARQVLAQRKS